MFKKQLKCPTKGFDNFYSLLVKQENNIDLESPQKPVDALVNAIGEIKRTATDFRNEFSPIEGENKYLSGFSLNSKTTLNSEEGLDLAHFIDDLTEALNFSKDAIKAQYRNLKGNENINEELNQENEGLQFDINYFCSEIDRLEEELEESFCREDQLMAENAALRETLHAYLDFEEQKELENFEQELIDKFFKNKNHSEGDR